MKSITEEMCFRQRLCEYAIKHGVTRAAKRYHTNRQFKQYIKYKLAAGKTAKSILISCGARLAPFDIQELRDLMKEDELELDTLGDRKTKDCTLYYYL